MTCKNILTVQKSTSEYNGSFQTYGFMLKRSRTATLALVSRLRLRSVNSFSFVQVMWTRSGPVSALSLMAACDAVFLSWMSWAWGGQMEDYYGDLKEKRWRGGEKEHGRVTRTRTLLREIEHRKGKTQTCSTVLQHRTKYTSQDPVSVWTLKATGYTQHLQGSV